MANPTLNPQFVITIPTRNDRGEITGEKQFVLYAGLLSLAHQIGIEQIHATLIQIPTEGNGMTAIVRAVVQGRRGTFTGLGDASPESVNRKVVRHLIRVAETRAKARALRDFTNVSLVALEELGEDEYETNDVRPAAHVVRLSASPRSRDQQPARMTDAQRRALFRKALALGHEGTAATAFLTKRLGVDIRYASKEQASKLLDELSEAERANGVGDAAG